MNVLVAGIGNIFFADDGFGTAVIRELEGAPVEGVRIADFGIRGLHLAYELLAGYDAAILVDALPKGESPGTLYVVEPDPNAAGGAPDAHRMDVQNVFAFARVLEGTLPALLLVGCEPDSIAEGIGLSEAVAAAVNRAAQLVRRLIDEHAWEARASTEAV